MSVNSWLNSKDCPRYAWLRSTYLGLIGAFLILSAIDGPAAAREVKTYRVVTGNSASQSYALGIGIASLVKIEVMPDNGIDLEAFPTSGPLESFVMLNQGDADFALLGGDWDDLIIGDAGPPEEDAFAGDIQAVAALSGKETESTLLVTRRDVDQKIVYEVTKVIFEQLEFLRTIDNAVAETSLDTALTEVSLALHEGARLYYQEKDALPQALASSDDGPTDVVQEARTFTVYFDLGEAAISEDGAAVLDELESFARSLKTSVIWIAGYTDTTGDADLNLDIAQKRADAVLAEIQSRQIDVRGMDVTALGERSPWVVTADQIPEARNRRVEILVEPVVDRVAATGAGNAAIEGDGETPGQNRPTF